MTRGSRGEEGTYRNKFPVPASRTLSEKEERKGNRDREMKTGRRTEALTPQGGSLPLCDGPKYQ